LARRAVSSATTKTRFLNPHLSARVGSHWRFSKAPELALVPFERLTIFDQGKTFVIARQFCWRAFTNRITGQHREHGT
jgi:hypothetical protein